jgi:hypothetical protein
MKQKQRDSNENKVLYLWGIVWGTYFVLIVKDCNSTSLMLILQYKYGGGVSL